MLSIQQNQTEFLIEFSMHAMSHSKMKKVKKAKSSRVEVSKLKIAKKEKFAVDAGCKNCNF